MNSAKQVDRSALFSKYNQQQGSTSPSNTYSRRMNNQLSTDIKKSATNLTGNFNTNIKSTTSSSPIISILNKPIFSNIFILNSNTTNANNSQHQQSQLTSHRMISRSNKASSDYQKPQSPAQQQQQQQQNFYNFTSNQSKTSNYTDSTIIAKQPTSKDKTNLSSYFTNLLNQNPQSHQQQSQSQQQQQSLSQHNKKYYSQKLNGRSNTPVKANLSRNHTNMSNLSNYNNSTMNTMNNNVNTISSNNNSNNNGNLGMILALNKFGTMKHSATFNYKLTNHYHQSTPTPTGTLTDNEIISRMFNRASTQVTTTSPIQHKNEVAKYFDTNTIQEIDVGPTDDINNNNRQELTDTAHTVDANLLNDNKAPNKMLKINEKQNILKLVNQAIKQAPESIDDIINNYDSIQQINMNDEQQKTKILHSILHNNNNNNANSNANNLNSVNNLTKLKESPANNKMQLDAVAKAAKLTKSGTPHKRSNSARTFRSRDINDSYAYNDVKKYIEENDLMSPEKAEFIKIWIKNVNLYLKDLEQTVT
jgi:hypothetical protein